MRIPRISTPAVLAVAAVTLVLSTGTAYAINEWTGANIKDSTLTGKDIKSDSVPGKDITDGTIKSSDIKNDSLKSVDILNGTLTGADVADESLTGADVADFGLSNQDIGVLFAEVSSGGAVDNSSGGVTAIKLGGTGTYEVDFGRDITACTAVATVGPSGAGSALGEVNVADRAGNAEAIFVDTNDSAGAAADRPFRLVVVC